jgi:predicted RNA binding protein YcfA (HicA-like mRNA interferase family)
MDTDHKQLIKSLEAQGFEVVKSKRRGHFKVYQDGKMVTVFPATTRNRRGMENLRATLRRLGANV